MKRLLFVLTIVMSMMMSVCFASDGSDLDKEQDAAQGLISVFENKNIPSYAVATKDFADSLKASMDETAYANLPKEVQEKMGNLQDIRFYNYQRYDQGDRLTYIASFDKNPTAVIVFLFDKQQKMVNFVVSPLQQTNETVEEK